MQYCIDQTLKFSQPVMRASTTASRSRKSCSQRAPPALRLGRSWVLFAGHFNCHDASHVMFKRTELYDLWVLRGSRTTFLGTALVPRLPRRRSRARRTALG
jgi:hypothetical protein